MEKKIFQVKLDAIVTEDAEVPSIITMFADTILRLMSNSLAQIDEHLHGLGY